MSPPLATLAQSDARVPALPLPVLPPAPPPVSQSPLSRQRQTCRIIYTGGTIGMKQGADGSLAPTSGYLQQELSSMIELKHPDCPQFSLLEWDRPIDSSDFAPENWIALAKQIETDYYAFDGFVILHGTDTLAYTASALSFMLENLGKTVILTGSMIPLAAPVSDAKRNVIVSLMCAVNLSIPEVCVFFGDRLVRGNRCRKLDPFSVTAFESPNFPPLATMGTHINIHRELCLTAPTRRFHTHTDMHHRVASFVITPAFDFNCLLAFIRSNTHASTHTSTSDCPSDSQHPLSMVLQLYGNGNGPTNQSKFRDVMHEAAQCGAVIVVTTQCVRGSVDMSQYETGSLLSQYGVIDGHDMTIEACVTKLSYLLSKGWRGDALRRAMEANLRGELTVTHSQAYNANDSLMNVGVGSIMPFIINPITPSGPLRVTVPHSKL